MENIKEVKLTSESKKAFLYFYEEVKKYLKEHYDSEQEQIPSYADIR